MKSFYGNSARNHQGGARGTQCVPGKCPSEGGQTPIQVFFDDDEDQMLFLELVCKIVHAHRSSNKMFGLNRVKYCPSALVQASYAIYALL